MTRGAIAAALLLLGGVACEVRDDCDAPPIADAPVDAPAPWTECHPGDGVAPEGAQIVPLRVAIDPSGAFAMVDLLTWDLSLGVGRYQPSRARWRVDLRWGHALIVAQHNVDPRRLPALASLACAVDPVLDLEVRAFARRASPSEDPGVVIDVLRHGSGERLAAFAGSPFAQPSRTYRVGAWTVGPACCGDQCAVACDDPRDVPIAPTGCRAVEDTSPGDGFCHVTYAPE
jgi:hypothetical protein